MKLLLLFIAGYYLVKFTSPILFQKKKNKKSNENIIDADFEEIE